MSKKYLARIFLFFSIILLSQTISAGIPKDISDSFSGIPKDLEGFLIERITNNNFTINGTQVNLSNLADVNLTGLSDEDIIKYDSSSGKWIAAQSAGGQGGRWNVSGTNLYPENLNYNVGIGKINPTFNLDVNGSSSFGNSTSYSTFTDGKLQFNTGREAFLIQGNQCAFAYLNDTDACLYFNLNSANLEWRGLDGGVVWASSGVSRLFGINTPTPQQTLHVNGSILANSTINSTLDVCIEGGNCLSNQGVGSLTGSGTFGYIPMWNSTSSINNSVIFQNGTNIGIGTINPASMLAVEEGATFGSGFSSAVASDGYVFIENRLGINTTTPLFELDVNGDIRVPKTKYIIAGTSTNTESISITHDGNNGLIDNTKGPWYIRQRVNRDMIFMIATLSGLEVAMRLDGSTTYTALGDIPDPATRLHLLGDTGITYSIINGGSDGDIDLLNVDVTGSPKLKWNESEDNFEFTKGLNVVGDLNVTTTSYSNIIQLSNSTLGTCNGASAGQIKYNGTKHYGCDGSSWNGLY